MKKNLREETEKIVKNTHSLARGGMALLNEFIPNEGSEALVIKGVTQLATGVACQFGEYVILTAECMQETHDMVQALQEEVKRLQKLVETGKVKEAKA